MRPLRLLTMGTVVARAQEGRAFPVLHGTRIRGTGNGGRVGDINDWWLAPPVRLCTERPVGAQREPVRV